MSNSLQDKAALSGATGPASDRCGYKDHGFYHAREIQAILDCGRTKAYSVIQEINKKRKDKGLLVVPGKVRAEDFNPLFWGD